jgi:hypothetical protein
LLLISSDEPAIIVVLTIRSDGYERLQLAKELEVCGSERLPPMPSGSYAEVIKGPADAASGGMLQELHGHGGAPVDPPIQRRQWAHSERS